MPRLPVELQRKIFLLIPPQTAHTCLSVAIRVKLWLDPILYAAVCLTTDSRARKFLASIEHRPKFALSAVKALCLNVSVDLDIAASILTLCAGIKYLNMRFPCHLIGTNPILIPLNELTRLSVLYVDLSSIFNSSVIYLPNVALFHRVTHLHLCNAWATWDPVANSIGLAALEQVTHLSLYLSTIRTLPRLLRNILDHENLAVLVLWKRSFISYRVAATFLIDHNLVDKRVLVLDGELFRHHMLDDNFWQTAERVVKSRENDDASIPSDDDNGDPIWPHVMTTADHGFHSDIEWEVKTETDPSEFNEESGEDLIEEL